MAFGNLMESDAEKAELLNSFFVRKASLSASDGVLPNILAAPATDSQTLTELSVSLQDVQRACMALTPGKHLDPTASLPACLWYLLMKLHHVSITSFP